MPEFAIIGSGAAGSLTAWRLRQHFPDARIVVFERDHRIGGRASTVPFAGEVIEVGGTLLHSSNKILCDLASELDLDHSTSPVALGDLDASIAIWDGKKFLFRASTKGAAFLLGLVRRYGLGNLRRFRRVAVSAVTAWTGIYALQASGRVFDGPADILGALGLSDTITASFRDIAYTNGVSPRVMDELAMGVLRNMYNQDPEISGFAGTVGLAGAGLAGGSLFSIAAGNAALFSGALERVGADVRLGTAVVEITAGRTVITAEGVSETFDAVVLAAPNESAGIRGPGLDRVTDNGYQTVHVTLIAGLVNPAYFGTGSVPGSVFTTKSAEFKSFGRVGFSAQHTVPIYKIFSADAVDEALLGRLFSSVADTHALVWQAYPKMTVDPTLHSFTAAPGIYTANVLEAVMSTLETEAVAGWSVADLVARDLASGAGPDAAHDLAGTARGQSAPA